MKTEGRRVVLYLFPQETVKLKLRSILRWARCVVHTKFIAILRVLNLLQNAKRANDKTLINHDRTLSVLAWNTWALLK